MGINQTLYKGLIYNVANNLVKIHVLFFLWIVKRDSGDDIPLISEFDKSYFNSYCYTFGPHVRIEDRYVHMRFYQLMPTILLVATLLMLLTKYVFQKMMDAYLTRESFLKASVADAGELGYYNARHTADIILEVWSDAAYSKKKHYISALIFQSGAIILCFLIVNVDLLEHIVKKQISPLVLFKMNRIDSQANRLDAYCEVKTFKDSRQGFKLVPQSYAVTSSPPLYFSHLFFKVILNLANLIGLLLTLVALIHEIIKGYSQKKNLTERYREVTNQKAIA
ncbi:MAG: hypothetical protein MHMPM18_001650 [Marteilia pararefringens]